jgi:hypothetical protein
MNTTSHTEKTTGDDAKVGSLDRLRKETHQFIIYGGNHPEAIRAALAQRGNFEEVSERPTV